MSECVCVRGRSRKKKYARDFSIFLMLARRNNRKILGTIYHNIICEYEPVSHRTFFPHHRYLETMVLAVKEAVGSTTVHGGLKILMVLIVDLSNNDDGGIDMMA